MDPEIKKMLDDLGHAWEEYKKVNDARIVALEAHKPTADLDAKLGRINEDMTTLRKDIDDVSKKANRPPAGSPGLSVEETEHKAAFGDFLRKGAEGNLRELEKKALRVGSDPDGGYFADTETVGAIDRVALAEVTMRRLANVTGISTSKWSAARVTAGMTATWAGETTTSSETTNPKIAEIEITPGKQQVEPYATNDLLEDATIDIGAWLAEEAGFAFVTSEGEAFITGSGINKPRGIMSYTMIANASYAWGKVGYIASGTSGAFNSTDPADCLFNLQHALKPRYRVNGTFLMNDATLNTVRQFKDGFGGYLWRPGLTLGAPDTLLGKPVEIDDYVADIENNSYSIAFADFKRAYQIVDRRGVTVLRDPYTSKPYTKFYTTRRVGGGIVNFEAIKVLKFAAS